jgi:hypothetical protein
MRIVRICVLLRVLRSLPPRSLRELVLANNGCFLSGDAMLKPEHPTWPDPGQHKGL